MRVDWTDFDRDSTDTGDCDTLLAKFAQSEMSVQESLNAVVRLTFAGSGENRIDAMERALSIAEHLRAVDLPSSVRSWLFYVEGNAWSELRRLRPADQAEHGLWESQAAQNEMTCYRRALLEPGFSEVPPQVRCERWTNCGNLYLDMGRPIEAIENWNLALAVNRSFGMALANKGRGLFHYSSALYDAGHRRVLLACAVQALSEGLSAGVQGHAKDTAESYLERAAAALRGANLEHGPDWDGYSFGESQEERDYRRWCLDETPFLNPLKAPRYLVWVGA